MDEHTPNHEVIRIRYNTTDPVPQTGLRQKTMGFAIAAVRRAFAALVGEMLGNRRLWKEQAVYLDGTTLWIRSNSRSWTKLWKTPVAGYGGFCYVHIVDGKLAA